ncbi:MAG: serine hydrolase [Actinomycetota bacterium]
MRLIIRTRSRIRGPGALSRRRSVASAVAALVAVASLAATSAAAPDPERYSTALTGWGWYTSVTETDLNVFIDRFGMRLADIEVVDPNTPKFAATLVHNSGTYHRPSWHWYFGLTFDELVNLDEITSGRERALDVENYIVNGQRRYAIVTVNNQNDYAKGWWWYFNASKTFIKNHLQGRRIIDIDRRPNSSNYNVIMIANTGEDAKKWWYYYSRTPAQIKNLLKAKKGRLVDIERAGTGKYNIVMVRRSGEYWWWYYGLKGSQIGDLAAQNGARIFDIERYSTSGGTRYAVLMLNDVNSLTTKVREIMKPGTQGAAFGFYLKRVGGPVYAGLQTQKVFEPASTIKVLHHLHAMRAVMNGQASLTEDITWYVRPTDDARYPNDSDYADDKNKCAYDSDGNAITSNPYVDDLGNVILRQMMEQSDNRSTDAVLNRFGMNAINGTADFVAMNDTQINHRIGCPSKASPSPFKSNELTLYDAGLLYEGVANGSLLGTGTFRDTFYEYMLNSASGWKPVVDEEAADLGLSQSTADQFLNAMEVAVKGGSYDNGADCPDGDSGVCRTLRRTGFGVLYLPFKVRGGIVPTPYVYGSFVDGFFACGSSKKVDGKETACDNEIAKIGDVRSKAHFEMLRPRIRAALMTW